MDVKAVQQFPEATTSRRLPQVAVVDSGLVSTDLPRDTTLKSIQIRLSGNITTTFGSGTPVADAESIMDNLVQYFQVQIDGGRIVKSVRPHFLRIQQILTTGNLGERKASAAAAAAAQPTTSQGFVYGSSTHVTTLAETINLQFEMPYCEPGTGKELTWLQLKNKTSATIKVQFKPFSSLLGFGNTAPVVFSANNLVIDYITKEAQYVETGIEFYDFRQTSFDEPFSSETTLRAIDLSLNNFLAGLMLFAKDGAAGSATTASGKLASDLLVTNIALKRNGREEIVNSTFKAVQADNFTQYGVNATTASSVSLLSGIAYINLLNRKNIDTALDCRRPATDSLFLNITTNTASNVSYTNPAILSVMSDEIIKGQ